MAIACAGLLGYRLVINFDAPYLAGSIQDFWRRWHISLSEWIRDYIYISLGGRSRIRLITYRNLMITMLLGGLWHGAAWTFVVWGGLHGLGLVIQREYRRIVGDRFSMPGPLAWFLTINFVCICWIFFRADSLTSALYIVGSYLFLYPGGSMNLPMGIILIPILFLFIEATARRLQLFGCADRIPLNFFVFSYGASWAIALALLPLGYRPFIYFQF